MQRRSSVQLLSVIALVVLSACSEAPAIEGANSFGAPSPTTESTSATPAAAQADLRAAADFVQGLEPTVGARSRAFPAGNVEEVLTAGGEVGSLQDLGCFAAANENGPNTSTPVDCAQPHLGETFASVPMDDTWPTDYAAYAEGGAARERWLTWADAQCVQMVSRAVDGDGAIARALGVDGPLHPTWDGYYGFSLPREPWDAGTRVTHCWAVANGDVPPRGRWLPTLLSASRPNEVSFCIAGAGGDTTQDVRCDQPHYLEWTFAADVGQALGQSFVNSVDPDNPTTEQNQVFEQFCTRAMTALVGVRRDDLRMLGYSGASSWGVGGRYVLWCTIVPADTTQQVSGSAIGLGDAPLQLTPYPA
jgi:Septum formation